MEKKKRPGGSIYRAGRMRKGRWNSNGPAEFEGVRGCGEGNGRRLRFPREKIGDGRYVKPVTCNDFKVT